MSLVARGRASKQGFAINNLHSVYSFSARRMVECGHDRNTADRHLVSHGAGKYGRCHHPSRLADRPRSHRPPMGGHGGRVHRHASQDRRRRRYARYSNRFTGAIAVSTSRSVRTSQRTTCASRNVGTRDAPRSAALLRQPRSSPITTVANLTKPQAWCAPIARTDTNAGQPWPGSPARR